MRQANFDHHSVDADGAHIYTNPQGIIVELSETWLNQEEHLLEHTVKQLNSIHRLIKINGILLCIDVHELLLANQESIKILIKAHAKLLERFALCVSYPLDTAILLTKLDLVAGFCDFFESEHPSDLAKPLGFSIYDDSTPTYRPMEQFKEKFDALVMSLGLQVTRKMHPIRSHIKRTSVREFPLQIASLRNLLLPLVGSISSQSFRLQALYLTSGEQGGQIQDRLNKKIQHEFALTIPEQRPLSTNYRTYFIEGALYACQQTSKREIAPMNPKQLRTFMAISAGSLCAITFFIWQYTSSMNTLDKIGQELKKVRHLNNHYQSDAAVYHLAQASDFLETLSSSTKNLPVIKDLHNQLQQHTTQQLNQQFIPHILNELAQTINETNTSLNARYQALKIYLMLDGQHFSEQDVLAWFTQHWQSDPSQINHKLVLLKQVLHDKTHQIHTNPAIVIDARNYLNALPIDYLFYNLAKTHFDTQTLAMQIPGFNVANTTIPIYMTQPKFLATLAQLPGIAKQLMDENWVLARQDLSALSHILEEAYCKDYVNWWQHFMTNTNPLHIESYSDAQHLTETLRQTHSIAQLISIIQSHTKPQTGAQFELFNRAIASQFSEINLLSATHLQHLNRTLNELELFSKTLALVSDQGKTAFTLTKARFQGDKLANPVSLLYEEAQQFPDPLAKWTTQIANDTWYMLINNSRAYINQAWQDLIFKEYQKNIAHRFPLDSQQSKEIALHDFNHFFATHGQLNHFMEDYIKPFLDTRKPQWQLKEVNHYVLPISNENINELIRANVITHMFFPNNLDRTRIEFTLQKISLDPVVSQLQLTLGDTQLLDSQKSEAVTAFKWPKSNARLILRSVEGKQYELDELGQWALFKLLQKVNVLVDEHDSANLQILFEINGNTGRYLLRAHNQVNPFIPGILEKFTLADKIV